MRHWHQRAVNRSGSWLQSPWWQGLVTECPGTLKGAWGYRFASLDAMPATGRPGLHCQDRGLVDFTLTAEENYLGRICTNTQLNTNTSWTTSCKLVGNFVYCRLTLRLTTLPQKRRLQANLLSFLVTLPGWKGYTIFPPKCFPYPMASRHSLSIADCSHLLTPYR